MNALTLFFRFFKIGSFCLSASAVVYLAIYSDCYQLSSAIFYSRNFLLFLLISPAVISLFDLFGRIPLKGFRFSLLRMIPSLWFSSLIFRVVLAEQLYLDEVVNRFGILTIRRIWSNEEKSAWVADQLASTPYTPNSADFSGLVERSSSFAELKEGYAQLLLQLQQPQPSVPSVGFFGRIAGFCSDHPLLFGTILVLSTAAVVGGLLYTETLPTPGWLTWKKIVKATPDWIKTSVKTITRPFREPEDPFAMSRKVAPFTDLIVPPRSLRHFLYQVDKELKLARYHWFRLRKVYRGQEIKIDGALHRMHYINELNDAFKVRLDHHQRLFNRFDDRLVRLNGELQTFISMSSGRVMNITRDFTAMSAQMNSTLHQLSPLLESSATLAVLRELVDICEKNPEALTTLRELLTATKPPKE